MQKQAQKQAEAQKQIEVLEKVVREHLNKDALQRYGNLKSAHPEKAMKAISVIVQLIQQGYIKKQLTDEEFKGILIQIEEKKEFNIRR